MRYGRYLTPDAWLLTLHPSNLNPHIPYTEIERDSINLLRFSGQVSAVAR